MSIHEVVWDLQGRITSTRCVDDEIILHQEKPTEVLSDMTAVNNAPVIKDTLIIGGHPDDSLPFKVYSLTAGTVDSVREMEAIQGVGYDGQITDVVLSDETYFKDEINRSRLSIGDRGYIWSEPGQKVDIFVAPAPKPGLGARLRTALGR